MLKVSDAVNYELSRSKSTAKSKVQFCNKYSTMNLVLRGRTIPKVAFLLWVGLFLIILFLTVLNVEEGMQLFIQSTYCVQFLKSILIILNILLYSCFTLLNPK